jgi:hypothetical protein
VIIVVLGWLARLDAVGQFEDQVLALESAARAELHPVAVRVSV